MHENQFAVTETKVRIGASTLRVDLSGVCVVTYVGILDVDVIKTMNAALQRHTSHDRPLYLVVDLARAGTVTQLGRRHGAGGMLALNPAATAVVGASFHMRVIVELITKAAQFLNAGIGGPVAFFASEMDALMWMNRLQKESRALQ